MNQQLNVDSNLKILADSFSSVNLNKISGLKHTSPAAATQVIKRYFLSTRTILSIMSAKIMS